MAHFRRNKPRIRTSHTTSSMNSWPAWHDIVFHRRPHRRETKAIEHKVLLGLDGDAAEWPLAKKPHKYYW